MISNLSLGYRVVNKYSVLSGINITFVTSQSALSPT